MNQPVTNTYPTEPSINRGELPDPFALPDGGRVRTREEWTERAQAWSDMILNMEYGGLPPVPDSVTVEALCHSGVSRWEGAP